MRVREYLKMERNNNNKATTTQRIPEEPFEGMELDSEDSAISFYLNYASRTGFRTRFSRYCRSLSDNSIISRQIICSKSGFHQTTNKMNDNNEATTNDNNKRGRTATKVGCKAMIEVKRSDTGKWVVSKLEKEHNHELSVSSKKRRLYESQQEMRKEAAQSERAVLYEQLYKEAVKFAEEGSATQHIYEIAIAALRDASDKVAAAKKEMEGKMGLADQSVSSTNDDSYSTDSSNGLDASSSPVQTATQLDRSASTSFKNGEGPLKAVAQVAAALSMPVTQSLAATVAPSGGAIEAMPISSRLAAPVSSPPKQVTAALKQKEEGSRVHATAVACGARVIPADQALSLVKFIQAKIRSGQAIIAPSNPPLLPPHIATIQLDNSASDD
ncbi:hypothetical protein LUZ60_015229 [Juncus effusus]|nr:hypothetical protein LUZ60_015229 [Juncus effusus]